jgi:chromosome segregation ATPase
MNQDTLKLITAKIEKTLEQVRALKSEKTDLEAWAADLQESLNEKDKVINELKNSKEQLLAEIRSLQEALNERDSKLQDSAEALLQAIETVNKELGVEGGNKNLFNINEGNV